MLHSQHQLGVRLWRDVGKGAKDNFAPGKYKAFITFSRTVHREYGKNIKVVF